MTAFLKNVTGKDNFEILGTKMVKSIPIVITCPEELEVSQEES